MDAAARTYAQTRLPPTTVFVLLPGSASGMCERVPPTVRRQQTVVTLGTPAISTVGLTLFALCVRAKDG